MAIGDVYRLSIICDGGFGTQAIHDLAFRQETTLVLDTPANDLIQCYVELVESRLQNVLSNAFYVSGYRARQVDGLGVGEHFYTSGTVPGERTGDTLPPQATAIISWKTGLAGRSFRGRSFMPPAVETDNIGGNLQATYKADLGSYIDDVFSMVTGVPVATAGWAVGVVSLWDDKVLRPSPLFTPYTSALVRDFFGTQRSRRPGTGS